MRRLLYLCLLLGSIACFAMDGQVGDRYDSLEAQGRIYKKVKVQQITPEGLILFHSRGIAKVPFAEISADLQTKYGYDPAAEAAYIEEREREEALAQAARAASEAQDARKQREAEPHREVLDLFGSPPTLNARVDMRKAFNAMNLHAKDQGRRPSCSVFAVVSALEFENAKASGKPEKLSEEYLVWATRDTLGIPDAIDPDYNPNRDGDLGFSLVEVVQALRRYGIPDADSMPNTFGKSMSKIETPSPSIIKEARERREIRATYITGRTNKAKVQNIIHALNAVVPVVIGIGWPHQATLRNAPLLSKQTPRFSHAVTLVGYTSETGRPEDTRFLFKNSWGPRWGIAGHGWITQEYMEKHLNSAVIVEVK